MKAIALSRQPTFIYFWLGILTGALIVMASLMIRSYADNGTASVLSRSRTTITAPRLNTASPAVNTKSMGPNNLGSMGPNNIGAMGPNN